MRVGADACGELGDDAKRRYPADAVEVVIRVPQVAIGARRDVDWLRTSGDAGAELGDDAKRGNPRDPVAVGFRKPQIAIGAGRDSVNQRTGADTRAEFGDNLSACAAGEQAKGHKRAAEEDAARLHYQISNGHCSPRSPVGLLRMREFTVAQSDEESG